MRHYAFFILPIIAAGVLLEWSLFRGRLGKAYPWRESGISLVIAGGHQLSQLLAQGLFAGLYLYCWNYRLLTVPLNTAWGLLGLFLGVEFIYYWEHRLSHTVRWFWATHAVHHSPNELTLSSAFRLGWTGPVSGTALFFLPLILLGFHPLAIAATLGVNLLYQFWLHTQLVPTLSWFDRLFNSPSNHRVHHASNPQYLDRNFGGILIIFDRLFGTYASEDAATPCRYGLVVPQYSGNPVVVALDEWRHLFHDSLRASNPSALLRILFGPPEVCATPAEGRRRDTTTFRHVQWKARMKAALAGCASAVSAAAPAGPGWLRGEKSGVPTAVRATPDPSSESGVGRFTQR